MWWAGTLLPAQAQSHCKYVFCEPGALRTSLQLNQSLREESVRTLSREQVFKATFCGSEGFCHSPRPADPMVPYHAPALQMHFRFHPGTTLRLNPEPLVAVPELPPLSVVFFL